MTGVLTGPATIAFVTDRYRSPNIKHHFFKKPSSHPGVRVANSFSSGFTSEKSFKIQSSYSILLRRRVEKTLGTRVRVLTLEHPPFRHNLRFVPRRNSSEVFPSWPIVPQCYRWR